MTPAMLAPPGYHAAFHAAEKKGYSGVGIYARQRPLKIIEGLGVPEIDAEGRYIEFVYERLSVISIYFPSGSSGEERQTVKYRFLDHLFGHLETLAKQGREVVLCGDWNIAHKEIDLKNWKGNLKNSGFLPEERAWLTRVLAEQGWIDVYRKLHPEVGEAAYTWWSNRGQAWAKKRRVAYRLPRFHPRAGRDGARRLHLQRPTLQRPRAADHRLRLESDLRGKSLPWRLGGSAHPKRPGQAAGGPPYGNKWGGWTRHFFRSASILIVLAFGGDRQTLGFQVHLRGRLEVCRRRTKGNVVARRPRYSNAWSSNRRVANRRGSTVNDTCSTPPGFRSTFFQPIRRRGASQAPAFGPI